MEVGFRPPNALALLDRLRLLLIGSTGVGMRLLLDEIAPEPQGAGFVLELQQNDRQLLFGTRLAEGASSDLAVGESGTPRPAVVPRTGGRDHRQFLPAHRTVTHLFHRCAWC